MALPTPTHPRDFSLTPLPPVTFTATLVEDVLLPMISSSTYGDCTPAVDLTDRDRIVSVQNRSALENLTIGNFVTDGVTVYALMIVNVTPTTGGRIMDDHEAFVSLALDDSFEAEEAQTYVFGLQVVDDNRTYHPMFKILLSELAIDSTESHAYIAHHYVLVYSGTFIYLHDTHTKKTLTFAAVLSDVRPIFHHELLPDGHCAFYVTILDGDQIIYRVTTNPLVPTHARSFTMNNFRVVNHEGLDRVLASNQLVYFSLDPTGQVTIHRSQCGTDIHENVTNFGGTYQTHGPPTGIDFLHGSQTSEDTIKSVIPMPYKLYVHTSLDTFRVYTNPHLLRDFDRRFFRTYAPGVRSFLRNILVILHSMGRGWCAASRRLRLEVRLPLPLICQMLDWL